LLWDPPFLRVMGGTFSSNLDENKLKDSNLSNNSSVPPPINEESTPNDSNTNTNAFAALAPLRQSSSEIFLVDTIADNPVVIFSKTTCGFCDKAKSVFDSLGVDYKTVELDSRDDCAELQDNLLRMTGARTVPRVYVGGECIGGGSDTISMFKQGLLQKLLRKKNIECPRCDAE